MELPKRKPTRLKNFDYSKNGYYFVTICTHKKHKILCNIVGAIHESPEIKLNSIGIIVDKYINQLNTRFLLKIDKYVIMPNHIHSIIIIKNETAGASPCPTLSDIVCTFKSITTHKCHLLNYKLKIWQTSFHDHITRDENDYLKIWNYIDTNPQKWREDCFYNKQ